MRRLFQTGIVMGLFGFSVSAHSETILHIASVDAAPTVDGIAESVWDGAQALIIPLTPIPAAVVASNKRNSSGKYAKKWSSSKQATIAQVSVKAVVAHDQIYFLANWQDASKDDKHKPWKWQGDKKTGEYMAGKEREDRLALMFPMSGTFSPNKLAGEAMSVDVWHWKAARTNAVGIAHDKSHVVTLEKPKGKSASHYSAEGKAVYVSRPGDGPSPYGSNNIDPFIHQGDEVAKYVAKRPGDANSEDVAAKGVWSDGHWSVEFGRKLDTGHHQSDTVFAPGEGSKMAIAVFDHAGDHHHVVSETVTLVFD